MELLVVVLCLLSERFLVHKSSHNRFHWFMAYGNGILSYLPVTLSRLSSWAAVALIVLPLLLLVGVILHFIDQVLFGVIGLLINIAVFYYCIGPVNPFYPVHAKPAELLTDEDIGNYLTQVNGELFAILFWYLVLGPLGILAYRLISLSQGLDLVRKPASELVNIFDWLPARMTALLYLLVGNFQAGYQYLGKLLLAAPNMNKHLLSVCGLAALSLDSREQKTMISAENLVEHATIVFLVLLAFCTIVAWV